MTRLRPCSLARHALAAHALAALVAAALGCASTAPPAQTAAPTGVRRHGAARRVDRSVLTQAQLEENHFHTAYEAVAALRSTWLTPRGPEASPVWVYFNENWYGGVERLREIPASVIVYIKHYDGITATARWGLNHGQGVIYVSTLPAARGLPFE
jgi:hypothetical protein